MNPRKHRMFVFMILSPQTADSCPAVVPCSALLQPKWRILFKIAAKIPDLLDEKTTKYPCNVTLHPQNTLKYRCVKDLLVECHVFCVDPQVSWSIIHRLSNCMHGEGVLSWQVFRWKNKLFH